MRRGRGFAYLDEDGRRIEDPEVLTRIAQLAIPPAWQGVWICPFPNGHLQATGTDAAGRKQYRYHDAWRVRRDSQKFDEMVLFAKALPQLRRQVDQDLRDCAALNRDCVLACAVRLLERGFFRIGSELYAEENESFGLATLRKQHVTIGEGGVMIFDFPAKSGQRRHQGVLDERASVIVAALKRRRGGGPELLAFKEGRRWRDVRSPDINEYLKRSTGGEHSAKAFRTWNATALAAIALAVSRESLSTKAARKRAVKRAIDEVAIYLGNTPAVCRASYIDPRVFDAFDARITIAPALERVSAGLRPGELPINQPELEQAVLDLIDRRSDAAGLEKVAA